MPERKLRNRLVEERPIRVSYTAWKRFSECPLQEALLRLGVPRAQRDRRITLVGNVLHAALERVVRDRQLVEPWRLREIFDWEASKDGMFWRSLSDRDELLRRSAFTLGKIQRPILEMVNQADDVKVEVEWAVEVPLDAFGETFVMTAKLDLAVLRSPRLRFLDYKSGLSPSIDADQLRWYATVWSLFAETFPPGETYETSFHFLWVDRDRKLRTRRVELTDHDRVRLIEEARKVALALRNGRCPAKPEAGKCSECRVRISCAESAFKAETGRSRVATA